ncbi:MAG: hypothetical protein ABI082_01075 [Dokdonella sp.]
MNAWDASRLDALARALALSPRELLVAALQLAETEGANEDERLRLTITQLRAAPHASEAVAALLLTPITSFAQDDIDRALAQPWPAASSAED